MGSKPPKPTPPRETSAASTSTNVSTAIANAWLKNIEEDTPIASTRFDRVGTESVYDPYTDKTYEIPRFRRTTQYTPVGQEIVGKDLDTKLNLAELGRQQSEFLKDYLARPIKLGNEQVESRMFDLATRRLDPRFQEQRDSLRARLANQGIKLGSDAYDRAMRDIGQQENDAINQLLLRGRGQAVQEQLTERNQPLNEITALMSGSQLRTPRFMGADIPSIPTTNNAAIIANYDNARMQQWQAGQSALGGLLSGFGSLIPGVMALSDRRAKKDVKKVGKLDGGLNIYTFRYKGEPNDAPKKLGLMAQEVKRKKPHAVKKVAGGLLSVDYQKAVEG